MYRASYSKYSASQLDFIKNISDSIENSHYLIVILHRIFWILDNPDLAHLQNSVGGSSSNGSSSNLNSYNFFEKVYSEYQKIKNKGIPVFYIAGGNDSFSLNLSSLDNDLYHIHTINKNKAQIEEIIVHNPSF